MFIALDAFKSLLDSNPIIVFDTSVYLDLLRFSKNSSEELLKLFETVINDIEVVPQINAEFARNIKRVCGQRTSDLKNARKLIKTAINSCSTSLETQLSIFQRLKFDLISEFKEKAFNDLENLKSAIDEYTDEILGKDSFLAEQEVSVFFGRISKKCSQREYTLNEIIQIIKDGEIRYRYKIPPGYMDHPLNTQDKGKEGIEAFGDLILWLQVIDLAKAKSRQVLFITSDLKEDWFLIPQSQPISPREELLNEFKDRTGGKEICILPRDIFIEYLSGVKRVDIFEILLEMQIDDYTDWVVTKYKDLVMHEFVEWGNTDNHIQQFPFVEYMNYLLTTEKERLVVKSSSFQIKDSVEYWLTLQGVANFFAKRQQDLGSQTFENCEWKAFFFELTITFMRPIIFDESGKRIAKKDIENLRIINAVLESADTSDIQLKSKRGIFTVPSTEDKEVFQYMDTLWEQYEDSLNSTKEAEERALVETARHFNKPLLEVYRSYSLVQSFESDRTLSLNEIDILSLVRFTKLNLKIEAGDVIFGEEHIPLGHCYPMPESLVIQPPEIGKELKVTFDVSSQYTEKGRIIILGTTNLPKDTCLMMTLRNKMLNYSSQSKCNVLENGSFMSEEFSDGDNPPLFIMTHGTYSVEISMPLFDLQPNDVKVIIGKQNRNLTGEFTKRQDLFGTTVNFVKELDV